MSRYARCGFAIVALLWLCRPLPVFAHASIVRTDPPDPCLALSLPAPILSTSRCINGRVLQTPPSMVSMWFSEPVELFGGGLRVLGPSGRRVDHGPTRVNGTQLSIAVNTTELGTYEVRWGVIAADTHPAHGSFTFSVGHLSMSGAGTTTSELSDSAAPGLLLQAIARWLHFVGYALGFGVLAFQWLIVPPGYPDHNAIARRLRRLVNWGIGAMLLAEPLALIGQTGSLGVATMLDPRAVSDALDSGFGRALTYRLGAAMLLWVLVGIIPQLPPALTLALGIGGLLALLDGLSAHALSVRPLWFGLVVNGLHLAAMGLWAGGLVALIAVWRGGEHDTSLHRRHLLVNFSRLAATSVGVLAVTGGLLAWQHLSTLDGVLDTPYGIVLAVKVGGALVVLAIVVRTLRAAQARRKRGWMLEAVALAGVLALAGLLVSLSPPR